MKKASKNNQARQMALFCAGQCCRGRYRVIEIAAFFDLSPGGFSSGRSLFRQRLKADRGVRKRYEVICAGL